MPNTTDQPNQSGKALTGDQIMSAARDAVAEEFPDATPTPSDHANRLANRLVHLLKGGEW